MQTQQTESKGSGEPEGWPPPEAVRVKGLQQVKSKGKVYNTTSTDVAGEICNNYNAGKRGKGAHCKTGRQHACLACGIPHPATSCPGSGGGGRG